MADLTTAGPSFNMPSLPRDVVIDGKQHTILHLGVPVHAKAATKNLLVARGFTVDNLTVAGYPLPSPAENGDEFAFVWFVWLTLTPEQQPVSRDLLEAIVNFSKDTGRMPLPTPTNRTLVTLADGRTTKIPVLPEAVDGAPGVVTKKKAAAAKLTAADAKQRFSEEAQKLPLVGSALLNAYCSGNLAVKAALNDVVPVVSTPVPLDSGAVLSRLGLNKANKEHKRKDVEDDDDEDDEDDEVAVEIDDEPAVTVSNKRKLSGGCERASMVFSAMVSLVDDDISVAGRKRLKIIARFASGEVDSL